MYSLQAFRSRVVLIVLALAVSCPVMFAPGKAASLQVWDQDLGTFGSTPGSFIRPVGVAVDSDGNVFVVDLGNASLQRFEANLPVAWPSGKSTFDELTFWELGDAKAAFVTVDDEQHIYLTDMSCDCLHMFDAKGTILATWGSEGGGDGEFRDPAGLATDDEDVFVVDSGNHRVQKFSRDGRFVATWGSFGKEPGNFSSPTGIALDADGNVYIADTGNDRIQKFNGNGVFLMTWGTRGSGESEFEGPTDVALDQEGQIYVVDSKNDRVQVFGVNGEYISEWGKRGSGKAEFNTPLGIAIGADDHSIYVSDSGNSRVQRFMGTSGEATWGVLKKTFRRP